MKILTALAALPLAACMANSEAPGSASSGSCKAGDTSRFVGAPATPETATAIKRATGASTFRWLPPGTMVTMEYNGNRVNVDLDEANRVKAVRCG